MRYGFGRTILALVLGLGVLAGLIRAAEPPLLISPDASAPAPVPQTHLAAQPWDLAPTSCESDSMRATTGRWRPLRDWLQNHPSICCWAHHNTLGCGSLKSECNFIFGSCRTFYGEPCLKGPSPFPGLPGYGFAPAGCNCP